MRLYLYRTGRPGFVLAEAAVKESMWAEHLAGQVDRRFLADQLCPADEELLTRSEMLEVSTRRRALLAWEARDDVPFEHGMESWGAELDDQTVRDEAARGCPDALAIISRGLDRQDVEQFVREHVCEVESCFRALARECGLSGEQLEAQVQTWRHNRRSPLTLVDG
jgi:hypothetical protein